MAQQNYPVVISAQVPTQVQEVVTKTVMQTQTLSTTLSDSAFGVLQDASVIAGQLGSASINTEHIALAILTRKTPTNVTTTGGRILRDTFGVDATRLAAKVCEKASKSAYALSAKFGGFGR